MKKVLPSASNGNRAFFGMTAAHAADTNVGGGQVNFFGKGYRCILYCFLLTAAGAAMRTFTRLR